MGKMLVVAVVLVLATGCGGGTGVKSPSAPGGRKPAAAKIDIKNFRYGAPLTVRPGAKITVRNDDKVPHTVTVSGVFDVEADPGKPVTFTAPSRPGTYKLICRFHPDMYGTLMVR